jgi:hypothetical protein
MASTRGKRASELLGYVERGPSLDLTFAFLDGIEIGGKDRIKLEAHLRERYRLWATTWPLPLLRDLLAQDLGPPRRRARPRARGMDDLIYGDSK